MSEIISNQELLVSNMLEIQALIRILEKKGITNQDEILEEVKKLKVEMEEKIKKMGRENWNGFYCFFREHGSVFI